MPRSGQGHRVGLPMAPRGIVDRTFAPPQHARKITGSRKS
jgi:hypothetical protein